MMTYLFPFMAPLVFIFLIIGTVNGQMIKPLHPCDRPCNPNTEIKICQYDLTVTYTRTLNPHYCGQCPQVKADCYLPGCAVADGHLRPIYLTNNQFPGPEIRVCEDDIVMVNVSNQLLSGESLTIHWHGIHQETTPFMDGVPMVTQCGIEPGTTFEYVFEAKPAGTHFWHAHAALVRDQGIAGGLIVRPKHPMTSGPKYEYYENDLNSVALIQDWSPIFYPPYFVRDQDPFFSIVVNGRQGGIGNANSPPSYFIYNPRGQKPFLRIVSNGFLYCPISLSIEGHRLKIVRSDGHAFQPVIVDEMYIYTSERYDVFLEPITDAWLTNNQFDGVVNHLSNITAKNNFVFEMKWQGSGVCKKSSMISSATSYLIYTEKERSSLGIGEVLNMIENSRVDFATQEPTNKDYKIFNLLSDYDRCEMHTCIPLTDIKSLPTQYNMKDLMSSGNFRKIYMFVDSSIGNELPNINNISFIHPTSPLLSQYPDVSKAEFCNLDSNPECSSQKVCHCVNSYEIKSGEIVELIIADESHNLKRDTHTFHLHGYSFAILAQERLGSQLRIDEVKKLDELGQLKRNFDMPVIKDTVTVPEGGYAIVRFKADNPGFWILHCHLGFHLLGGMAVVFKVGEYENMLKVPLDFPKCGSWRMDRRQLNL